MRHLALWTLAGFGGAFVLCSFIEWLSHRFILHSKAILKFAYELHDRQHHVLFNGTDTYHASCPEVKAHVKFVPRDYVLFLAVTTPLWIGAQLLLHQPVAVGGVLATLLHLQMFNSLHWRFHVPSDTWFQRTWYFRFLKEHHRRHHQDPKTNYNVSFLPLADTLLGTRR